MRVLLKLTLDCAPDAAWEALRSPVVLRQVSLPLLTLESLEPSGFPPAWTEGAHPVRMRALGVPIGSQTIGVDFLQRGDARVLHDSGAGLTGLNALFTEWDHRMAISPDPAGTGKTLYRDQLRFGAGALTPLLWPGMWAVWQMRAANLRRLAPSWNG